ncbi:hypothetical protein ACJX0J_019419, partial [Zea mays]
VVDMFLVKYFDVLSNEIDLIIDGMLAEYPFIAKIYSEDNIMLSLVKTLVFPLTIRETTPRVEKLVVVVCAITQLIYICLIYICLMSNFGDLNFKKWNAWLKLQRIEIGTCISLEMHFQSLSIKMFLKGHFLLNISNMMKQYDIKMHKKHTHYFISTYAHVKVLMHCQHQDLHIHKEQKLCYLITKWYGLEQVLAVVYRYMLKEGYMIQFMEYVQISQQQYVGIDILLLEKLKQGLTEI